MTPELGKMDVMSSQWVWIAFPCISLTSTDTAARQVLHQKRIVLACYPQENIQPQVGPPALQRVPNRSLYSSRTTTPVSISTFTHRNYTKSPHNNDFCGGTSRVSEHVYLTPGRGLRWGAVRTAGAFSSGATAWITTAAASAITYRKSWLVSMILGRLGNCKPYPCLMLVGLRGKRVWWWVVLMFWFFSLCLL